MKIETRRAERPGAHCLYCRESLPDEAGASRCAGCAAVYHEDCIQDELGGRCATPGCGTQVASAIQVRIRANERCRCQREIPEAALSRCTECRRVYHTGCLAQLQGCCVGAGAVEVRAGNPHTLPFDWEARSRKQTREIEGVAIVLVGLVTLGGIGLVFPPSSEAEFWFLVSLGLLGLVIVWLGYQRFTKPSSEAPGSADP